MVILTPYVLPAASVGAFVPPCSAGIKGNPCPLCGMTTAFYHIANGEFGEARLANRNSVILYSVFLANEAALACFAIYKTLRRIY
jgi:hypothetical protein